MSPRLKRILGASACFLVLVVTALSSVTFADSLTPAGRFGAPGFPRGLSTTESWGESYGALGGVILKYVSTEDYSSTNFYASVSVESATVYDDGKIIVYHIHSTIPIKKMQVIIPIHIFSDNAHAASYTFKGAYNSATTRYDFTSSYSTSIAASNNLRAYYPGGSFSVAVPSNIATGYLTLDWDSSVASQDWDLGAGAVSPADAYIDGDYSNVATGVFSVLDNEGVTTVGSLVVQLSSIEWVSSLIAVTVLLVIVALLMNFLMTL